MVQRLSVATVIEKNRIESDTPFLVFLDIAVVNPDTGRVVETLYFVENSEPVDFDKSTYLPSKFSVEIKSEASAQHSISLSLIDYTQALQARMQTYGGGVGFRVIVSIANAGDLGNGADIREEYEVTGASAKDYYANFILGSENALNIIFPRRKQTKDYCQWRYKDKRTCGYVGSMPSCDLTLQGDNGCERHNNHARFGGFPGINISRSGN